MINFFNIVYTNVAMSLLCLICFDEKSAAQNVLPTHQIKFEHLSTAQGLSQSCVQCILQDNTGFMWFGTRDGLCKYDGYNFVEYRHEPNNNNSLKNEDVMSLLEDKNGLLWIATQGGLEVLNQKTGKIIHYSHDDKDANSLCSDDLTYLMQAKDERIWIGTTRGISVFDPQSKKFRTYKHDEKNLHSLSADGVQYIYQDKEGRIWIGTEDGLNLFNSSEGNFTAYRPAPKSATEDVPNFINCMLEDHTGKFWVATAYSGLYLFDPKKGVIKSYKHDAGNPHSIETDLVSICEDHKGNLWLGTSEGIDLYSRQSEDFIHYSPDHTDINAINNRFIYYMYEDRSGMMWVATNGSGLNKFVAEGEKFNVARNYDSDIQSHYIIGVSESHDGLIRLATFGGGMKSFDPKTRTFKEYRFDPKDIHSGYNSDYCSYEDRNGMLWVGSYNGLSSLDLKTGATQVYQCKNDSATPGIIEGIIEGEGDTLYLIASSGLKIFDRATKRFSVFPITSSTGKLLSADWTQTYYKDHSGILWIGGNAGLYAFNRATRKIELYQHDEKNIYSISDNQVNGICEDHRGNIWMGTTASGLNVLDRKTGKFYCYTMLDGLPSNVVNGIVEDNCQNLWISTAKGISKFTPPYPFNNTHHVEFRNYDVSDGIPGNDNTCNTLLKSHDGTIYLGTSDGLYYFHPDSLKDNQYVPQIAITDFLLFNKPVVSNDTSKILKQSITDTKEITLAYNQNDFSFAFAALSYVHPEKNKYAYKLDDFDKDWIYTDATKRFANYTNLAAGEYVFEVKGSNNDGVWNETPPTIKLIITPPFWQTWWFRILVGATLAGALYGMYRYRLQQVIKLQMIRNNIASDLHDDIGSTLNSISIFSEVAKRQAKEPIPALEQIGLSARKIIDSIDDLVWTINPENDSFEKIIERMRELAYDLMSGMNIEFTFRADSSLNKLMLPMQTRKNFYLIFKEATNNIVKYSKATRASFNIAHSDHMIRLVIRDNGVGFDVSKTSTGNGIKNMKWRAKEINAEIVFSSSPNEGTSIELNLKS